MLESICFRISEFPFEAPLFYKLVLPLNSKKKVIFLLRKRKKIKEMMPKRLWCQVYDKLFLLILFSYVLLFFFFSTIYPTFFFNLTTIFILMGIYYTFFQMINVVFERIKRFTYSLPYLAQVQTSKRNEKNIFFFSLLLKIMMSESRKQRSS